MERHPFKAAAALPLSVALVLLASTPTPAHAQQCSPCDWNADGRLDCDDPTLFMNAWYADLCNGTRIADFNHDSVIDQRDIVAFVGCWNAGGSGCITDPPPANDRCANAQVLTGSGLFNFQTCRANDTTGEGTGPGPSCSSPPMCVCGGPFCDRYMRYDVWFEWTAPANDQVTISTAGLAGGADTALAIYLGPARCHPWSHVAYYSDTGPLGQEAEVTFPAVVGQKYIIQLGTGRAAWSGPQCGPLDLPSALGWHGQLAISVGNPCVGPITNDACSTPMTLAAPSTGTYVFGATTDGPPHAACFASGSPDIANDAWFQVVAPTTTLQVATTTPGLDTRIAVYDTTGAPCGDLAVSLVACADDQPGGLVNARVTLTTTPGHAYLVRIGKPAPGPGGGCFDLAISAPTGPACPPAPPPQRTRAYTLAGSPSGAHWSWCVQTSSSSTGNADVPGVGPGVPLSDLRDAFVASINKNACGPSVNARAAAGDFVGFIVRIGGDEAPQLWVGPGGGPALCLVGAAACSFNPDIAQIPLSGQDCNDNGADDAIDIAAGDSFDLNRNGVPDSCEKVVCPDWDGNGVTNSTDVSEFINSWFADQANGTMATEINGDGVSNSTDVSDFINAYFAAAFDCTT